MFPMYPCNKIKKIHHQLFSIKYYVNPQKLTLKIHQKWNFTFFKSKFGMLELELDRNWVIIMQDEKRQFYSILCTNLWMAQKCSL